MMRACARLYPGWVPAQVADARPLQADPARGQRGPVGARRAAEHARGQAAEQLQRQARAHAAAAAVRACCRVLSPSPCRLPAASLEVLQPACALAHALILHLLLVLSIFLDDAARKAGSLVFVSRGGWHSHCSDAEGWLVRGRFFFGQDYMEIVLDIHAWAYLARRAFASYTPKLGSVVFENAFVVQAREAPHLPPLPRLMGHACASPRQLRKGFFFLGLRACMHGPWLVRKANVMLMRTLLLLCDVLQGNSEEELPELVLACARVSRVDFSKARERPLRTHSQMPCMHAGCVGGG